MISTGNQDNQKFSTGEDNNQDSYNIFYKDDSAFIIPENKNKTIKIVYPNLYDFGLARYYNDETGENKYYYTLELGKIVSFIKKEFQPYDENKSIIELALEVYNKELVTTRKYYINSVDEPRLEEMIQGLKDYGFTMSEGSVEECYYNYLGTNRSLGYAKN